MPEAITGRIVSAIETDDGVRLIVNRGTDHGLTAGYVGTMRDDVGQPIDGGRFVVSSVGRAEGRAVVRLPIEKVATCRTVLFVLDDGTPDDEPGHGKHGPHSGVIDL